MQFSFKHTNINVLDLEKSLAFYRKALGLKVVRTKEAPDGSFKLVFTSRWDYLTSTGDHLAQRPPGTLRSGRQRDSYRLYRSGF